jgi:hypothetical protein
MTRTNESTGTGAEAGEYEIRLQGRLDARWGAWFEGLSLGPDRFGGTVMSGPVTDQAALHGLLQKVRDLGLPLISVTRIGTEPGPLTIHLSTTTGE